MQWYNAQARRRIKRSVEFTERFAPPIERQRDERRSRDLSIAILSDDLEHGKAGSAKLGVGSTWMQTSGDPENEVAAFNAFFPKLWAGCRVLLQPVYLAESEDKDWMITHAWSATRIRGTAAAAITPGGSGTINSVVALNGHYPHTTAAVKLDTTKVSIGNGLKVWAELEVHQDTDVVGDFAGTYTSEWHAYASDCEGA